MSSPWDTAADKPKLLVIDDEPAMGQFVCDVAARAGFQARAITDAARLAQVYRPDLAVITLDLSMPGTDGVEVLRQLAALSTGARIILLSGYDAQVLRTAFNLGHSAGLRMAGRLSKPVRAAELMQLLREEAPTASPTARRAPPSFSAEAIRAGIEAGELVVHFQPQLTVRSGEVVGLEALVRWQHPEHGLLFPDAFIRTAEQAGLGLLLTERVLEQVLALGGDGFPQWGEKLPIVSVNLPPQALTDVRFPDRVTDLLARHNLPADRLTFELTETSVAAESGVALDILTRLRLKGIRLSIDDYGVGYSSMEQLSRLPFTELKIDKQFVLEMAHNERAVAIVRRTVALGHDLGLTVLAEGVETESLWWMLRDMDCDLAQGYYMSRPLPFEALPGWLAGWQPPRPPSLQ